MTTGTENAARVDDTQLGMSIDRWKMALTALAAAAVGAYFTYFTLVVGLPAAVNPDKWGTFGDFFGGLMNPIVAFAAFYWLTQSVKLQKQELVETRMELKSAADAQQLLVENGRQSVRLAALTAVTKEIQTRVSHIDSTERELKKHIGLTPSTSPRLAELQDELRKASDYKGELLKDIERYFWEMREILDASSPGPRPPTEKPPTPV